MWNVAPPQVSPSPRLDDVLSFILSFSKGACVSPTQPLVMINILKSKTTYRAIPPPLRAAKVPHGLAGGAAAARLRRCDLGGIGRGLK